MKKIKRVIFVFLLIKNEEDCTRRTRHFRVYHLRVLFNKK